MKNLFKSFTVVLILLFIQSCNKDEFIVEQGQSVKFKNLEAFLPVGYDAKILNYTEDDYGQIINLANASARVSSNDVRVDLYELSEMLQKVKKNYPDLSKMDEREVEKALKYFDKIDKNGVNKNREDIMEFFEKLIAYDLAVDVSKKPVKHSNKRISDSNIGPLNSCEVQFLIGHNRFADRVRYASEKAEQLEAQKFPNGNPDDSHSNAFKHAIWNALLAKHGGENYGTVSKAIEVTRTFTFLHEACGSVAISGEMDLHNNDVGLEYFAGVGYRYKVWCAIICNYNVSGPDDQVMADAIFARPVVQVYSLPEIFNTNNYTLVKLQ